MNKTYFYTPEDLPVMDLDQIYMTSSAYLATGFKDVWATFDLLVRDMPKHRNFLVFTGLEEMIRGIMAWRYKPWHIRLLQKRQLISPEFSKYLARFKFSGSVYAMKEGTIFFPGEPVLRITAPIIEANLLTAFLITSLTSNTIYASKYIRCVIAARHLHVIGTGPNRCASFEHAFKAERSAYITGSHQIPSPVVREKLSLPMGDNATIAYHAFISSYPTELEAMKAATDNSFIDLSLMIDTYDIKQGLRNAIAIAKKIKEQKKNLKIVLDSGDVLSQCRYVRKELDKAGLKDVRITLAGNLDEYKIDKMVKAGVPANTFIVATEAQTSSDDPKLEAVYKLSELIKDGKSDYKMKLSPGKVSLPGRKQVFRIFESGFFKKDVIGLEGEHLGKLLLVPMIKNGKLVYHLPHVTKIRSNVEAQLKQLPPRFKEVNKEYGYPVEISAMLKHLTQEIKKKHLAQYLCDEE